MFTLIHGARLFAPADLGVLDVLLAGDRIARIAARIEPPAGLPVEVVEAAGRSLTPGFIDLHVHLTGGGGEGGPTTRVPELQLSQLTLAGVTTALGLLGTDDITRRPETLLAKAQALTQEGITAFILAGSYRFPPVVTITGSLRKDIALIREVLGVGEVALSDHRSAQPTFEDFAKLAAEARVAGMIGGKPGLVVVHLGAGARGLDYLLRLVQETEIPAGQLLPTHLARSEALLDQAAEFAKLGGNLDLTAALEVLPHHLDLVTALARLKAAGVDPAQVTISSDAGGSLPVFDAAGDYLRMGVGQPSSLQAEFKRLLEAGWPAAQALAFFTANAAGRLRLEGRKGVVAEGAEADLIVYDQDWNVERVYARGRLMVAGGRAVVRGTFET